jgi:predicted phage baseplate assembly protein
MPLPAPVLDDRRWADIVAEAKARIPRYTPEWTDLNESDPGITLVELFSWLMEMVLYRLNQVPDLNYLKFLDLLDVRLRPAQPASVDLTFTLVSPAPATEVFVPIGTRIGATGGDSGPVVFETDEGLQAIRPALTAVLAFDGFTYEEATRANAAGDRGYSPFGPSARAGAALCLGFDYPSPFPGVEGNLLVLVSEDPLQRRDVHCDLADREIVPPATLAWEYWDGVQWRSVQLDRDDTRAFTRSGYVKLQVPGNRMAKLTLGSRTDLLYWLRARLVRAGYDRAPRLDAVLPNSVRCTQAETVNQEVLGGSDGLPDQTFRLFFSPVVDGSLQLQIDEGSGPETWSEVDDFCSAGPGDAVYTLDAASAVVTLGSGDNGRIAAANPARPASSVVAVTYRHGGGAAGNLPAGVISELLTSVDGVGSVTNVRPSQGGRDQETVEQAKARAACELKSRDRAVTVEDFEYLATVTPGASVARAIARGLAHPDFPGVAIPGCVTVAVIPDTSDAAPTPGEATLVNVCNHLNKHRLVTTEVHVVTPTYRAVSVLAQVRVASSADLGAVRQAVDAALTTYFHPLRGGADGTGWPLGGTIYYSSVFHTVLSASSGVARVEDLRIRLDGDEQCFCEDVPIGPGDLLFSDQHDIRVAYA